MHNVNFWIIVALIVGTLVATCLTRVIMGPIKLRHEKRRWAKWKQEHATGVR